MLLQTNSYIVPREKRAEHAKLLRRFRQTLLRLGCDHFEVYEQVGANWNTSEASNRFVQIMKFRDRRHQQEVQSAERADPAAQKVIADFCELINFSYQQQQGLFAQGYYTSFMRMPPTQQASMAAPQNDIPLAEEHSPDESIPGEVVQSSNAPLEEAPPYDGSDSGVSAAMEDDSQDTMIDAESRPASAGEEDDLPPIDSVRRASHARETSPGNNGHDSAHEE